MKKLKRIWDRLGLIMPLLTYDTMSLCLMKDGKDSYKWEIATDGFFVKATIKLYEEVEKRVEGVVQDEAVATVNKILNSKTSTK